MPSEITVAQFRSFRRRTTLELRPLTLLYGPNNVGKSALLRLLPLLGDSVAAGATVPLVLSGAAGRGAMFSDCIWNGPRASDEVPFITVAIHWKGIPVIGRVEYEIHTTGSSRNVAQTPIVRALSAWSPAGDLLWRAQRQVKDDENPASDLQFSVRTSPNRSRGTTTDKS